MKIHHLYGYRPGGGKEVEVQKVWGFETGQQGSKLVA
jgi:hypothetical protein